VNEDLHRANPEVLVVRGTTRADRNQESSCHSVLRRDRSEYSAKCQVAPTHNELDDETFSRGPASNNAAGKYQATLFIRQSTEHSPGRSRAFLFSGERVRDMILPPGGESWVLAW